MVGTEQHSSSDQSFLSVGGEGDVEVVTDEAASSGHPEVNEDEAKEVIDRLASLGYLE